MSEMIERVARAIHDDRWPLSPWSIASERTKEDYRGHARAAIEALREPTKAMIAAGRQSIIAHPVTLATGPIGVSGDGVQVATFVAMIEEALK